MFKKIFLFRKNIKEEEEVLINILTRTSNRPIGFHNCQYSVANQTYKNIRHLVSYDNDMDLNYINNYNIEKIKICKFNEEKLNHPNGFTPAPYNLYCNVLLDNVIDGWILFLDDDDCLLHNKVIQELVNQIKKTNHDTMFFWQMRYPNGTILPNESSFKQQNIENYKIGAPCFLFHSKYKNHARWDGWKVSDYRFIKTLSEIIPKKKWIEKVYVQVNNYGDLGKKNDISKVSGNYLIFNKTFFWYLIPKYHYKIFNLFLFQLDFFPLLFSKLKSKIKRKVKKMFKI